MSLSEQLCCIGEMRTSGQDDILMYVRMYIYIYSYDIPIGSMYGIYANIGGILMVNVTIYSIHGSYGIYIYIYMYLTIYRVYNGSQ